MKIITFIFVLQFFVSGCEFQQSPNLTDSEIFSLPDPASIEIDDESFSILKPLPDAIPVYDGDVKYILTDPTEEYRHGILGDFIEAKTLSLVFPNDLRKIDFSPQVFEGLFPTLADLDGDGEQEIITTLSGNGKGSQVVVFNQNLERIAETDALSSGWMHVLTVAPFGPNGEIELALVKKPHINQEVEFYELTTSGLIKRAGISKYSTHTIGSRNLEMYDVFEENGSHLLIVPTPDFLSIAAIGRTEKGAVEVWKKEIGERINRIEIKGKNIYVNGLKLSDY